ncbi:MAG: Uma2 family endonuclease [Gemmataceae bacterium]
MSTANRKTAPPRKITYPTSDSKPMAETDLHRKLMLDLITTLERYYADDPMVYVSGNLLIFYEEGNPRRHLSPDVFVVKGVPKRERLNYLVWEEGKGPDVVIELTSSSTRRVDTHHKHQLYRDVLRVPEYFLFDPYGDYLRPALIGYRLRGGDYVPIKEAQRRLPSKVLGLHLEQRGLHLRLYDPKTQQLLPTMLEKLAQVEWEREYERRGRLQAEQEIERARQAEQHAEQARLHAEREAERLRQELNELRRKKQK